MAEKGHFRSMVEFIPFKTMSMDLDSLLANLAKMYIGCGDADLTELITLAEAELFPIGNFDEQAQKYEYVLKLSVPVKFLNHQKHAIGDIQKKLYHDLAIITAPYIHEVISEVFVCIKIEQDPLWRETALDCLENRTGSDKRKVTGSDVTLYCAPSEATGTATLMERAICAAGRSVAIRPLSAIREKELHHLLMVEQPACGFGVFIVSQAFMLLPFPLESKNLIATQIFKPDGRCFQVWDMVGRAEVADFHPGLARSLALTTERMAPETITDYLLQSCALK